MDVLFLLADTCAKTGTKTKEMSFGQVAFVLIGTFIALWVLSKINPGDKAIQRLD
jgi:hypothetical protein